MVEHFKNEILEVVITDMGEHGEGIGKADGYTLFVKDAVKGDVVEASLTKVKKNYAYARLVKIIEPSVYRSEPICREYKRCGGCQIQALSYEAQLRYKQEKVINSMVRIGGMDEEYINSICETIIGMDNPIRYRNKAQYPIGTDRDGNIIAGFYAGRTHSIITCEDCMIGIEENKVILDIILTHMKNRMIQAYDENTGRGLIRHVLIRKGFTSGQLMVCIVISKPSKNGKEYIPGQEALTSALSSVKGMTSISVSINSAKTNVIMGDNVETIWGSDRITDELLGVTFSISPLAFYQVNPIQTQKLYSKAIEYADITKDDEVWDICCGIGTITLCAAGRAGVVHGLEIVPQAIEDAKENARINCVTNCDFICAAAEDYMPKNSDNIKADIIIMDPPRKGMDESVLDVVAEANPNRIVYVSCDPATLARDCAYLRQYGYEIKKMCPVDMFPQSVHVETVCLLVNQNAKAKQHVNVGIDAEDYYRIKNS